LRQPPAKPAPRKPVKRADDDDDDDRLPLWKKGVLVAGGLMALWWIGSMVIGWFEAASRHTPFSAEAICRDFKTDIDAARKKYVGNSFEVVGKVKLIDAAGGKRLVFDTGAGEWTIHCLFTNQKAAAKIHESIAQKKDAEVVIEGQCQHDPKQNRSMIVMEDCVVRRGL
jgi:hypothetical protein